MAIKYNRADIFRELHQADADITIKTRSNTLLKCATNHNNAEIVTYLLEAGVQPDELSMPDIDWPSSERYAHETALICVVRGDRTIIAKILLEHGADVNLYNQWHGAAPKPLGRAIESGNTKMMELLLEHNAAIDIEYYSQSLLLWTTTPLILAIHHRKTEVVSLLVDNNANVDYGVYTAAVDYRIYNSSGRYSQQKYWITPLSEAIETGDVNLVNKVLEKLPDINRPTGLHDNTPLILAVEKNSEAMVSALLHAGADVTKANKEGQTPLMLCNNPAIHSLLKKAERKQKSEHTSVYSPFFAEGETQTGAVVTNQRRHYRFSV